MDKQPRELTDKDIRQLARNLIEEVGAKNAAEGLGITRVTLLGLAAGNPCRSGTFALVRQQLGATAPGLATAPTPASIQAGRRGRR